jgi:hypothetical protein
MSVEVCNHELCKIQKDLTYAHRGYFCQNHRIQLRTIRNDLIAVKREPYGFQRIVKELYLRYEEMSFRSGMDDGHVRVINNLEMQLRWSGHDPGIVMSIAHEYGRFKSRNRRYNRHGAPICNRIGCNSHGKKINKQGYCRRHCEGNALYDESLRKLDLDEIVCILISELPGERMVSRHFS